MKYQVAQLTELISWPRNANLKSPFVDVVPELGRLLHEGYEIYKAIPLNTQDAAMIKYILRKEIKE